MLEASAARIAGTRSLRCCNRLDGACAMTTPKGNPAIGYPRNKEYRWSSSERRRIPWDTLGAHSSTANLPRMRWPRGAPRLTRGPALRASLEACRSLDMARRGGGELSCDRLTRRRSRQAITLHREGRHKARVFASGLGITVGSADGLRDAELHSEHGHGRRDRAQGMVVRHAEGFPRLATCSANKRMPPTARKARRG